jgi:hypothetical protein
MRARRGAYSVCGENLREVDHLKDPSADGGNNIKIHLQKSGIQRAWIGLIWLRIGTGGGHWRMW